MEEYGNYISVALLPLLAILQPHRWKDFSFFYKQGTDVGTKNSLLIISGKDWSEKADVPFKMPMGGKNIERYFYLSDLFKVHKEKEESYKEYNEFLNNLIITRIWGDSPIVVENRQ